MTKNEKNVINFVEVEVTGFQQICNRLSTLEEENEKLKKGNQIVKDELTYFKEYAGDLEEEVTNLKARVRELSRENHDLLVENNDMKFTRKFLTSEEESKQLVGGD